MTAQRKPTIYDLAKKAGVSIATISRATNPRLRGKLAPATLSRIDRLIERQGYSPSLAASRLAGKSFRTIGFLLPHLQGIFQNDYYNNIQAGISDRVLQSDHQFKLVLLRPSQRKFWDRYDFKAAEDIDALLITHWPNFFSNKKVLERLGLPCVVVNDPEEQVNAAFVTGDSAAGGRRVAEYLLSKGHRSFLLMEGPSWSTDSRARLQGFQAACLAHKSIRIQRLRGDFLGEKAEHLMEAFLLSKKTCDAVFCFNDHMALGVLRAMKRLGVRCPKDIAVAGYDDDRVAGTSEVPLTTVRVPVYQMVKDATSRLIRCLDGDRKALDEKIAFYPVDLIKRESA